MFTGLIETTGILQDIQRGEKSVRIGVLPAMRAFEVPIGASVSINGVCLTLESTEGLRLYFTAVLETLSTTTFKSARIGDIVNLERALKVSDRLDGHILLGHVDGVGSIAHDRMEGSSLVRSITFPPKLGALLAKKGSVALDGVSLTIAQAGDTTIEISFIPHTLKSTTMASKKVGDAVNIECDVIARYVARILGYPLQLTQSSNRSETITRGSLLDHLERSGF